MISQFFTSLSNNCGRPPLPVTELYEDHRQEELRCQAEVEEYHRFKQPTITEQERQLLRHEREHTKMQLRRFLQEEEEQVGRLSTASCVDDAVRDDAPVLLYTDGFHLNDDVNNEEEDFSEDEEDDPVAPILTPAAAAQKERSLRKNQQTTSAMTKQSLARIILFRRREKNIEHRGVPSLIEGASNDE